MTPDLMKRITVVLVCLAVGVGLAAQGGRSGGPPPGVVRLRAFDQAAVDRGKVVFGGRCASCHSPSGRGGGAFPGPDLIRSVLVLQDLNGKQIGEYLRVVGPPNGHPGFSDLTDQQVSDLATLLHRDITYAAERSNYKLLDILTGDAKAGEAYFNGAGGCNKCHSVTGDLRGIGARLDPPVIQGLIVSGGGGGGRGGPASSARAVTTATITLPSGETVTGVLVRITDFDVTIRDSSGAPRSWLRSGDSPKIQITNPLQGHIDLLARYTDADIHNLTAYLVSLKDSF